MRGARTGAENEDLLEDLTALSSKQYFRQRILAQDSGMCLYFPMRKLISLHFF